MIIILFFMLGVLLVGVSLLTYVLIKSLSRITELEKKNYEEEFKVNKRFDNVYSHITEIKRELHEFDERIIKDYENQFKDANHRMDSILDYILDEIKNIENTSIRDINESIEILIRNSDSRFDKFDNKLEDNKNYILRTTSEIIDETVKKDIAELNMRFYELHNDNSKKLIKG
jgi:hypothetical protein